MGFHVSAEAKEALRQKELVEEEKLRRLLRFQQQGKEVKKEEELDEEFNPNLVPLGGGVKEKEDDENLRGVSSIDN